MAKAGVFSFAKDYSKALIMLGISLVVLWAVLNFLHTRFSGNVIGKFAGTAGDYATGQKYSFQ